MKKKILAASLLGLFTLAATAYLEITGYNHFDTADGENPVCKIDPSCRQLEKEEIFLAKEVFGNEINYNTVKIFNRNSLFSWLIKDAMDAEGSKAIAPKGNIFIIDRQAYAKNFSAKPKSRTLYMHEMTHVFQYQNGKDVLTTAAKEYANARFHYSYLYAFDIYSKNNFNNFGIEQQAQVIEDYQRLKNDFKIGSDSPSCATIKKYEGKIQQMLPLKPFAPCQNKVSEIS